MQKKIEKKVARNMYLPKYLGRYVFSTKKNLRYVNVQNFKINFYAGSTQHWVKLWLIIIWFHLVFKVEIFLHLCKDCNFEQGISDC